MPETITLPTLQIKHKGAFKWEDILSTIRQWFKSNYFKITESKHKYRPDEKEVEITATIKKTEYLRYNITMQIFLLNQQEIEVIKDGAKEIMDEGRFILSLNGEMILDWQQKFTGKFLEHLQKFYHRYIIKDKIKKQWGSELENKMKELQKLIKETAQMEAVV